MHARGRRREAASLGDPRPEQTERPKLGQRDEFVGVRRHAERDPRARLLERKSALLERPQIAHARGEREGELLRGRAARRVRRPPVGGEERPAKPLAFQRCDEPGERSRLLVPPRPASAAGQAADRIEAEAETDILEARARPRDEPGKGSRLRLGLRPEVEFEARAFVETDPVECAMQRGGIPFAQAIAVRSGGAGEDDLQPVRAVPEILERLRVRVPGLGVIHARQHGPGSRRAARRAGALAPPVQRLESDPVRSLGDEPVQRAALQRSLHRRAPIGFGKDRERARKSFQPALQTQMNCERPGIAAEISPTTSSPAASRA